MKYAFFFMITLFLVGVFGSASWPKNGFIRVMISIFVSYIGVGYILPEEFLATAPFYSALVMAIVAGLPFAVLLLVSSQILQTRDEKGKIVRGKLTVGKIMVQFLLWVFYLAFLLWFTIRSFVQVGTGTSNWTATTVIFYIYMLILLIGTAWIVLRNGKFRTWIIKTGREINREVSRDVAEAVRDAERMVGMNGS